MEEKIISIDPIDDKYDDNIPLDYENKIRNPHGAHGGKKISSISVSPSGTYVITYSSDDKSIEGWIVENSNISLDPEADVYKLPEGLKFAELPGKLAELSGKLAGRLVYKFAGFPGKLIKLKISEDLTKIKVNDDKLVCYEYQSSIKIFKMSNKHQHIKIKINLLETFLLNTFFPSLELIYFQKNGNLVMVKASHNLSKLLVYSPNEKDDKLIKSLSGILAGRIDVEDNNIWNIGLNYLCLYQENFQDSMKMLKFEPIFYYDNDIYERSTIISNENLIIVKHCNEINVFQKEKSDPVQIIRIENSNIKLGLLSDDYFFAFNSPKCYGEQNTFLYHTSDINKQPVDISKIFRINNSKFILHEYNSKTKKVFGLIDGRISCIDLSSKNWDEFFDDDIISGWNTYLNNLDEKKFCNNMLTFSDMENLLNLNLPNGKLVQFGKIKNDEKKINIIEDDAILKKYGTDLFPILVNSTDPNLICYIESIYTKCIKLVKEDPNRNLKCLEIITSSINGLYKKYPDYIAKFNSEMFIFLDPSNEKIVNNESYYHFRTFSACFDQPSNDQPYLPNFSEFFNYKKLNIVNFISACFYFLLFIIFMLNIFIICLFIIIVNLIIIIFRPFMMFYETYLVERQANQYINLIVPYIGYSCYPSKYSWKKEILYPQPSEFVKTCKKEFYTNWNGEAVINHKWITYGKQYYFAIWLIFTIFLICFTIASYPTKSISQESRFKLYQTSIAFGFFQLIFEIRQFIWNPKIYFLSKWNLFGKYTLKFIIFIKLILTLKKKNRFRCIFICYYYINLLD
jgi:hypothetical protein